MAKSSLTQIYLEQIGHPILTREQVATLCRKCEYRAKILGPRKTGTDARVRQVLPRVAEMSTNDFVHACFGKSIQQVIQEGIRAAQTIASHNLRLVVDIARNFRSRINSIKLDELILEGNLALTAYCDRIGYKCGFDWKRGFKLSTHCTQYIKSALRRYCQNNGIVIRRPIYIQNKGAKKSAKNLREAERKIVPLEILTTISTHEVNGPYQERYQAEPGHLASTHEAYELVMRVASRLLDQREWEVLQDRFGLNGRKPKILKELKAKYGISRERIRQIEVRALEKLAEAIPGLASAF